MEHHLKIDEPYLRAKLAGDKLFEIRVNDRGYQKGDTVIYSEYKFGKKPIQHRYKITYVCHYAQQAQYCVFGERYLGSVES